MLRWTCETCRTKECSQCGAALIDKAKEDSWCAKCKYPPCTTCGCSRPRKNGYQVTAMQHWTCETCRKKVCSQCGAALADTAGKNTWCAQCAFPPCTSCGRARPQNGKYHGKVLPRWTCAPCRRNTDQDSRSGLANQALPSAESSPGMSANSAASLERLGKKARHAKNAVLAGFLRR